jgi:hypothetical protein
VLPEEADDPGAYRFAGWNGEWIEDGWNAASVFESSGALTPGYNDFLERYTIIAANIWDSTIELRRSDNPAGGYGEPVRLFDAVAADDRFIAGGIEHSALAADGGRTIAVSYYTDASAPEQGLHMVTFRFSERR